MATGTRFAFSFIRGCEEAKGVLKITQLSQQGPDVTIKLEGEIVGAWVDAVRDACATRSPWPRRLDLAAVTYVDAAGVQLLRELMAESIQIAACSSFVRELLHRQE